MPSALLRLTFILVLAAVDAAAQVQCLGISFLAPRVEAMALDPRDQLSLAPRIQKLLPGSTFAITTGPVEMLAKPNAPMSRENVCVKFSLKFKASTPIAGLSIRVVTATAAEALAFERTIATEETQKPDATADPQVTANVEYAQKDLQPLTADQVKQAMTDVALRA